MAAPSVLETSKPLGPAARGFCWGAATGALAAAVDTLDTALSGFDGSVAAYGWYASSALIFTLGVAGAALGGWARFALWLTRRATGRAGEWARAFALGLPGGAFMAWVPTSWITEHWPTLTSRGRAIALAVYPCASFGSTLLAWLSLRALSLYRRTEPRLLRIHFPLLALVSGVAAASYWADRRVLVDLYEDFHYGLTGAFIASCALLSMLVLATLRPLRRRALAPLRLYRGWLCVATLTASFASLALLERLSPDVFGPSSSVVFAKLVGTVRTWSDVDRDGTSSIFGGSDCDPFDAEVRPGKFDMPGNAADEDCSGTAAQWPEPEPEPSYPIPDRTGYNVLLISIDALRADHLGAYGYTRNPTSPNIDRLSSRSIRFAEAFSPSPKTYDTMPCLATGLYPSNVPRDYRPKVFKGRRKAYLYRITDEVQLLSEVLRQRGYTTFAAHGISILQDLGLDRGFERYQVTRHATHAATEFLDQKLAQGNAQPFFIWTHYYSPHHTYEKREGFDFGDDDIARYDSEIAFEDRQIGALLSRLDELGLSQRTIVILTADHGEEFRDHRGTQHGLKLYRELIHVPLVLHVPGMSPGVVPAPVELADVVPTVCDLLRLGKACGDHDGHSLLAAVAGKRHPGRGAYSELYRRGDTLLMNSLYTGEWRMIYDYEKDRAELYDARTDRAEQHNVASRHPDLVQSFRDRLATRTLYRQGQAFQRYEQTGDSMTLVEALPLFRHPRLLGLALDEIGKDVGARHLRHLRNLRKRPGLSRSFKARIDELVARAKARASAQPANDGAK